MASSNGGVRGLWFDGGPLVVLSQIGDATTTEVEDAIVAAVNETVALAEESGAALLPGAAASTGTPSAPPAAPAAPIAPVSR